MAQRKGVPEDTENTGTEKNENVDPDNEPTSEPVEESKKRPVTKMYKVVNTDFRYKGKRYRVNSKIELTAKEFQEEKGKNILEEIGGK